MRGSMRARLGAAALVAAVAAVATSCAIPIEDLGGASSTAVDINEAGVIVGFSEIPGSTPEHRIERPFRRDPDGTVVELSSPAGSTSAGAVAINDAGQIAGMALFGGPAPQDVEAHVIRWDAGGDLEDLGVLGGESSFVWDIDDQGRIVGTRHDVNGSSAFVADSVTGVVDLADLPGAVSSNAFGMNDEGDVVGYQSFPFPSGLAAPVRWDLDTGTATDLSSTWGPGMLGDINDHGTIVGVASFPTSTGTAPEGAILRAGDAAPVSLGAGSYTWVRVNDDDVVAGWDDRAFRWDSTNGAVWLAGDGASQAWGLNDRGQVVGSADGHATLFVVP